jgi:hypothetical protein
MGRNQRVIDVWMREMEALLCSGIYGSERILK